MVQQNDAISKMFRRLLGRPARPVPKPWEVTGDKEVHANGHGKSPNGAAGPEEDAVNPLSISGMVRTGDFETMQVEEVVDSKV